MPAQIRQRLLAVLLKTWEGWQQHDGLLLSAAMAYYAAFSFFPLCLVLISVLGLVLRFSAQAQDAQQLLLHMARENAGPAGPWLAEQLQSLLAGVEARAGLGGPIGIVALLIAAIGVFMQFDYSFNRIWRTGSAESRGWWAAVRTALYDRLVAFLMLVAAGGLLVAIFLADLVLAGIRPQVKSLPAVGHVAWHVAQAAFTVVSYTVLFGIIYKVLPKAPVRWREALAGGLLVAVVWVLGQQLLVAFVIGTSYTAYGVVGSFIAMMLWLYYASAVVFFGAEFVRAICGKCPADGTGKA